MKLILCPVCQDVRKLRQTATTCQCGASWGYYEKDGLNATIGGKAIPLGFANSSLVAAIKNRPQEGWGERFEAFVIPVECPTIKQT
jgi:hypothetical protein